MEITNGIDTGLPKFDDEGNYEGYIGSVVNIHERKLTEDALKESEEFSRTLLESSPDCVKALSLEGHLLSINTQGLQMLHIDDFDEVKGKFWLIFWENGQYYQDALTAIERAREGNIGHFQGKGTTFKGEEKWWDVMLAPIYDTEGKIERIVSVSRDVTKIKVLEQQKDDFLGIASHELKTPVTSIKAYAQVLKSRFETMNDNQSAQMLSKMDLQLDKLTSLITDLLDVTKIEQGKLQLSKERFYFNELVYDVVEEIQRTAPKHRIVTDMHQSCELLADKDRIGQVMINLLTNAIKYSPQSDKIVIQTECAENVIKFSVQDFGLGLSQEDCSKVFERFYRVEGGTSNTYAGLGLGLYISSQIIERHRGEIGVESIKGEGTTFYFKLPLT